jgi:hypothetical protein
MNFDQFLRKEAEKIALEVDKIEKKIVKAVENRNYDGVGDLNIQRHRFNAQEIKLYEMIGRLNELK